MCAKDADRMTNNVPVERSLDPEKTPSEAVWSVFTLFTETCQLENLTVMVNQGVLPEIDLYRGFGPCFFPLCCIAPLSQIAWSLGAV